MGEQGPGARLREAAAPLIDCVVSHHLNPYRSGVARFNEILAGRLGVPVIGLDGDWPDRRCPLISLKAAELSEAEAAALAERLEEMEEGRRLRLFVHDHAGLDIEQRLLEQAELVYAGHHEVLVRLGDVPCPVEELWAPGLILDTRTFEPTDLSVFSFGMAHKVRADMFARLRDLLEESGRAYALYMSHANHETTHEKDTEAVFEEMRAIFPRRLYFLGTLSDVAVFNQLVGATFFAAFFEKGVRANNTSVASAMEHGAVVITNLDEHSPDYLVHMENVIDLDRCTELPSDPLVLKQLSVRAMETARMLTWDRLLERMEGAPVPSEG